MTTTVQINANTYTIPDEVEIDPNKMIDEKGEVVRIVIGKPEIPPEQEASFRALGRAIDAAVENGFIVNDNKTPVFIFHTEGKTLCAQSAYVSKNRYNMYDIEIPTDGYTYKEVVSNETAIYSRIGR